MAKKKGEARNCIVRRFHVFEVPRKDSVHFLRKSIAVYGSSCSEHTPSTICIGLSFSSVESVTLALPPIEPLRVELNVGMNDVCVTHHLGVASSYRRNQTSVASYKPLLKFIQFRIYGIEGILYRVRKVKEMTTRMRTTLSKDTRLELVGDSSLPIIAFKLKASHLLIVWLSNPLSPAMDELNELKDVQNGHESGQPSRSRKLCAFINATGEMLVSYAKSVGIDVIRITLTYENANPKYVDESCRLLTTLVTRFNGHSSFYFFFSYRLHSTFISTVSQSLIGLRTVLKSG
ncbi:hypothetical protein Tcan_04444 [Toxocara canis]|uniref:Uncharacterized protein n=1 Tax=Toxocara canis TaxID=6265 RepID=A0A0B2VE97_TOXCA|nr:hypothetical protein Tcan_04444 [Toxocara canis]